MSPLVLPPQALAEKCVGAAFACVIVIAICWPPAQGEVDDEDEVFVMCCALRAAVTRASCVREVNAVVRGVPPGGGRPGLLTVTLALRTPFQLVDEPPPHAASASAEAMQASTRGRVGKRSPHQRSATGRCPVTGAA